MKLNPDCIRDILLKVEELSNVNYFWRFNKETIPSLFPQYSIDEIMYHLRQCELNGFLLHPSHSMGYEEYTVQDLTPAGHEFIANIRNDSFFNKVKEIGKKLGTTSLNDFHQIAVNCAAVLIKSYFNLP